MVYKNKRKIREREIVTAWRTAVSSAESRTECESKRRYWEQLMSSPTVSAMAAPLSDSSDSCASYACGFLWLWCDWSRLPRSSSSQAIMDPFFHHPPSLSLSIKMLLEWLSCWRHCNLWSSGRPSPPIPATGNSKRSLPRCPESSRCP